MLRRSAQQSALGVDEVNSHPILSNLEHILTKEVETKSIASSLPENELISDASLEALSESLDSSLFDESESETEYIHQQVVPPDKAVHNEAKESSFMALRATYLLITLVIMLADGLQGTYATSRTLQNYDS